MVLKMCWMMTVMKSVCIMVRSWVDKHGGLAVSLSRKGHLPLGYVEGGGWVVKALRPEGVGICGGPVITVIRWELQ